ncbi:MAG: hypothetical protein AAB790_00415 [Patescibacteria group bacterium]
MSKNIWKIYFFALLIGSFGGQLTNVGIGYYLNLPPQPTYEQLVRWHVRDHCGFPAHIDAWATCAARESDKFREQQIQLAVENWQNI